jgi:hypothetical protein
MEMALDEQQQKAYDDWVQEQLKSHVGHLYEHGLATGQTRATVAWALPGRICLSRAGHKDNPAWWVLSGGGTVDHIERKVAATPRLALKHFALKWQLQSARLADAKEGEADLSVAGDELSQRAEVLYALSEDDTHWVS